MAVYRHPGRVRSARREHVEHRDHQLTEHRMEGGILEPETDNAAHVLRCPLALRPWPGRVRPAGWLTRPNPATVGLSAGQRGWARKRRTPGVRPVGNLGPIVPCHSLR